MLSGHIKIWNTSVADIAAIEDDPIYKAFVDKLKTTRKRRRESERFFRSFLEDNDMDEIILGRDKSYKRDVKHVTKFNEKSFASFLDEDTFQRYVDTNTIEKNTFKSCKRVLSENEGMGSPTSPSESVDGE